MTASSNLWFPPSSPSSDDDEFDGSKVLTDHWDLSFTVSASAIDTLADFTTAGEVRVSNNSLRRSWLMVQPPHIASTFHSISRSPSPGNVLPDGFYWARIRANYAFGSISDNAAVGLMLSATDTGAPDADNYYVIYLAETDAGRIDVQALENENTVQTTTQMGDLENVGLHWEYVGILKDGSTYYLCAASPGGNWCVVANYTWGGAAIIDRFGFWFYHYNSDTPGNVLLGFDFFRRYTAKQLP